MMISNEDGVERPVARIRDLIPRTFVQLLEEDYSSDTQDLSKDDALRRALQLFACEDDESMDPARFVKEVTKVLRMDMSVHGFQTCVMR